MLKIYDITLGSDPEFFIRDIKTQEIVSSIGVIPGTKKEPFLIDNLGHSLMRDNVAGEFTTIPTNTRQAFIKEHMFMRAFLKQFLSEKGLEYSFTASEEFTGEQLDNDEARTLGCDPSLNMWTNEENIPPDAGAMYRSAAGHIHIGYNSPTTELSIELMRCFDLFVTLPSLFMDNNAKSTRRRNLYGKAGEARLQKHGLEARTLSNFWLESEALIGWVYDQTERAINYMNSANFEDLSLETETGKNIVEAINTNNLDLAGKIMDQFKIGIPKKYQQYASTE